MTSRIITARLGLRIRKDPEIKKGNIVAVIPRNTVVSIMETSGPKKNQWGRTSYSGNEGWMSLDKGYSRDYVLKAFSESTPFAWEAWPTDHVFYPDTSRVAINQKFGVNPQNYKKFGLPGHEGVDFYAPHGARIYSVAEGVVSRVGDERESRSKGGHNYGVRVYIDHGEYETVYAHLDSRLVELGEHVSAGQLIGLADNTGNSFGAHLHLTMKKQGASKNGETDYPYDIIDPTPFIEAIIENSK